MDTFTFQCKSVTETCASRGREFNMALEKGRNGDRSAHKVKFEFSKVGNKSANSAQINEIRSE